MAYGAGSSATTVASTADSTPVTRAVGERRANREGAWAGPVVDVGSTEELIGVPGASGPAAPRPRPGGTARSPRWSRPDGPVPAAPGARWRLPRRPRPSPRPARATTPRRARQRATRPARQR